MQRRAELEKLCSLWGVETAYYDIRGIHRIATDESLEAILTCLGCPVGEVSAPELILARERQLADQLLDPISIVWDGEAGLSLRLPVSAATGRALISISGTEEPMTWSVELSELAVTRRTHMDGTSLVELALRPPTRVPFGYHRIEVTLGARKVSGPLWSAPERSWQDEESGGWGLFCPVYSLRSNRNGGIGDLADLRSLGEWIGDNRGTVLATLPLLSTFIQGPYDPSPYSPVSRQFWNELYLAVDELPELPLSKTASKLWASAEYQATLEQLRRQQLVDYQAVTTHKRRLLSELAETCFTHDSLRARIEAHLATHPETHKYAQFRAVAEQQGRPFRQWPERLRRGDITAADFDAPAYRYHAYCQTRAEQQLGSVATTLAERGVGLYMDLPLGAHPDGYDAWRNADTLMDGCGTGAPPDTLFEGGQDWGFAPPNPVTSATSEHAHFRACLRHQMRHASILRIDHVMGLHRLYCVPRGHKATEGVYVRQSPSELYAAICIESHRARTRVVGEDLGTVPDEVRTAMARHEIGRLFVLQYEPVPTGDRTYSIPKTAIASINTHDMPTFAGYWAGRDIDTRVELGLLDASGADWERAGRREQRAQIVQNLTWNGLLEGPASESQLLAAQLATLAHSPAYLALCSVDDLLLEQEPQNVPGTGPERANWRRKLQRTLEEIAESPDLPERLHALERGGQLSAPRKTQPRSVAVHRFTEEDRARFARGQHAGLHDKLGAHPDDEGGTHFAVWAPGAAAVAVVGDFNGWDPKDAPLFANETGIWEGRVPGVRAGALYKLHIVSADGSATDKADPFAARTETPPGASSIVWSNRYVWSDGEWMAKRKRRPRNAPTSIYEVHLGSWMRAADGAMLSFRQVAEPLAEHVNRFGFTHVELMPIMEHPSYASWGYDLSAYFAPSSRYGRPEDLMFLIDTLHQRGVGVLLDWVPSHFSRCAHGLLRFDGTALFEDAEREDAYRDPHRAAFDHGRPEVRSFLLSSATCWLTRFHADGLRVPTLGRMLYLGEGDTGESLQRSGEPEHLAGIEALRSLNASLSKRFPDVQMIAGESAGWPVVAWPTRLGGLGFDSKWNMRWTREVLAYFGQDPSQRTERHAWLTREPEALPHGINVLPLSHRAVAPGHPSLLARMPGDDWRRFANLRTLYAFFFAYPGQKLLFMGGEWATWYGWGPEMPVNRDTWEAPMHHGMTRLVRELNRLHQTEPALYELDSSPEGMRWVDVHNAEQCVAAFERIARDGTRVLTVYNLTPTPRHGYRLGVSKSGSWREILNTDAEGYGGSGVGNFGSAFATHTPAHGRSMSIEVTLPPLAAVWFRSP